VGRTLNLSGGNLQWQVNRLAAFLSFEIVLLITPMLFPTISFETAVVFYLLALFLFIFAGIGWLSNKGYLENLKFWKLGSSQRKQILNSREKKKLEQTRYLEHLSELKNHFDDRYRNLEYDFEQIKDPGKFTRNSDLWKKYYSRLEITLRNSRELQSEFWGICDKVKFDIQILGIDASPVLKSHDKYIDELSSLFDAVKRLGKKPTLGSTKNLELYINNVGLSMRGLLSSVHTLATVVFHKKEEIKKLQQL
jgi:hypothetical protein